MTDTPATADGAARLRRSAASFAAFRDRPIGVGAVMPADDANLATVRERRSRLRGKHGGGGLCEEMGYLLAKEMRWPWAYVTYTSLDGEVICCAHVVNVLGDGSVIDATADQFGEGHDVRIVRPGDPEYGRYRPHFNEEANPANDPKLSAWLPDWDGVTDYDAQMALEAVRPYGWWLDDVTALLTFLKGQREIAVASGDAKALRYFDETIRRVRPAEVGPVPGNRKGAVD